MDRDFPADLRAVFEVIGSLDVTTLRFLTTPRRLRSDARHNGMDRAVRRRDVAAAAATDDGPRERDR